MPLVYQQNINACTKLGVWHIAEEESYFSERIRIQQNITHPHKRLQHMAGRLVLTELFPDFPVNQILIADTRKPFLPNNDFQFSISHCGDYAAAIVSQENKVGVDIEIPQIKIEKIIIDSGVTVDQFYEALKRQVDSNPENSFYVEVLLAATDFAIFVEMMKHYKRDHPKLK